MNNNYGEKPVSVLLHVSYIPTADEHFGTNRPPPLFTKSVHKRPIHKRVNSVAYGLRIVHIKYLSQSGTQVFIPAEKEMVLNIYNQTTACFTLASTANH